MLGTMVVHLALVVVAVGSATVLAQASSSLPPNVVFIVGDDVGYNDLGHFNGGKVHTPTIDGE
jgi:hypothetical protein